MKFVSSCLMTSRLFEFEDIYFFLIRKITLELFDIYKQANSWNTKSWNFVFGETKSTACGGGPLVGNGWMPSHLPVIRLQSLVKPLKFEPYNTKIQENTKIQIPNKNTTEKYKSLIRLQSGVEPLKFEPTKTLTALFSGPPKNLYLAIQIARQTQRKIPMTNNIILVEIACYQPYISWLTFSSPVDILK